MAVPRFLVPRNNISLDFADLPCSEPNSDADPYSRHPIRRSTDHGSYYYYHTVENCTSMPCTYQDTLEQVYDHAKSRGIPYKTVLYDSYWYFKGLHHGVTGEAQSNYLPA